MCRNSNDKANFRCSKFLSLTPKPEQIKHCCLGHWDNVGATSPSINLSLVSFQTEPVSHRRPDCRRPGVHPPPQR